LRLLAARRTDVHLRLCRLGEIGWALYCRVERPTQSLDAVGRRLGRRDVSAADG
jgi:hypothetical protein